MKLAERLRLKLESLRHELSSDGSAAPLTRSAAAFAGELLHTLMSVPDRIVLQRSARTASREPLLVHLGCGDDVRAGWLNIDFEKRPAARARAARNGGRLKRYDLRRGLPLPAGSCALIYSSHFLEHLEFRHAVRLMRDCHSALAPGGRFRAALPDLRRAFAAYVEADCDYFDGIDARALTPYDKPGMESLVDFINYCVYQHGEHRFIYDKDKIVRVLTAVGFSSARISEYDPALDPSSELRRRYSFYVEAVR